MFGKNKTIKRLKDENIILRKALSEIKCWDEFTEHQWGDKRTLASHALNQANNINN